METNLREAEQQSRVDEVLERKYRILCCIGGGGMARVYLAQHRLHGGLFAVKVLAEHLAQDARVVARFEQEARMAATLSGHSNIVPIFDIGSGLGLHYMIMQFVPGEDLAGYLGREGALSLPDAANVVAQTAEALVCAEAKHIVHRDLKPANMLLDENGRIKLLDFGISRIADLADGLTRPGESMGTPYYMSPEQIRGEACDVRSDLYSLGVVFFELVSGRRPFENESVTAIQMAHLCSEPPSLIQLDPNLPAGCDAIVQKLLAKRPEDRYQNAGALLQDLIARGSHSGPGVLRPTLNPGIRNAIEQAQVALLDRVDSLPTAPTRVNLEERTAVTAPVPLIQEPEPAQAEAEASTSSPFRRKWIVVAAGVSVVIALVVIGLIYWRPNKAAGTADRAQQASAQPPLQAVYSDEHGRMLLVPAGSFLFGEKGSSGARTVPLAPFYVDETEGSNAEYRHFCQATGHAPPQTPDFNAHPDFPVTGVSYQDAAAYAAWANKRLPTEEEWEKAARGSDGRVFPWGDAVWNSPPQHLEPVSAAPERRSPYGAYNMAGNAWEWTESSYSPNSEDLAAMKRLLGGQSFSPSWHVMKGGSFSPGGERDFAVFKRRRLPVDARSPWIGFRCVRSAGP
jgi:serine/threonine protein kinase/formylglycine-generating enzyme required for sulfatase activity